MIARGGRATYGEDVGILMLGTRFPRLRGDIGNAKTFSFPVSYLTVAGASPKRVVKEGDPSLLEPFIEEQGQPASLTLDPERVRAELAAAAAKLVAENPDIRAVVLECTNMPPFRNAIQEACGKPVYDIVTLVEYVHSGLCLS